MKKSIAFIIIMGILLSGCTEAKKHTKGVYMLLDTSGTYTTELTKAKSILNYLLGTLQPGDTLAVAAINTGSFSEKDIVAKVVFDDRPSVANNQKRAFKQTVDKFTHNVRRSSYTDISGGLLQAIEYLNEANTGSKYILIFSDLKEELAAGHIRDVPFQLHGFNVVGLNVTKLQGDIRDPKQYLERVEQWRAKVEEGDGKWRVVNDLERLDNMFAG
jgi:hypothetical protein